MLLYLNKGVETWFNGKLTRELIPLYSEYNILSARTSPAVLSLHPITLCVRQRL